jgi:hypothetical protein
MQFYSSKALCLKGASPSPSCHLPCNAPNILSKVKLMFLLLCIVYTVPYSTMSCRHMTMTTLCAMWHVGPLLAVPEGAVPAHAGPLLGDVGDGAQLHVGGRGHLHLPPTGGHVSHTLMQKITDGTYCTLTSGVLSIYIYIAR